MRYLIHFFLALILSLIFTPVVRYVSIKTGRIAHTKGDRWHSEPKALFGGIAIWTAWFITSLPMVNTSSNIVIILICSSLIFLLGLIDDLIRLSPHVKLVGQIVIASILVHFGIVIEIIPYPVISIPLTIFWIIGITNSFNLLDNMDGLSAGIASICASAMFILSLMHGNNDVALLLVALVGAILGFLKYNFNPASIFMGDCGSMLLGFILASLTIMNTWMEASNLITTMIVPVIVLGIPIFDTTFVTVTRKLSGRPISQGGRDHISHRLVYLGLSDKNAVLILYGFSATFAALSIYYNKLQPFLFIVISVFAAIGLYCMALLLGESDKIVLKDQKKDQIKADTSGVSKRRIAEVLIDIMLITSSYFIAYLLRYEGVINSENLKLFKDSLPWIIILKLSIFSYMGIYKSIWKYIGIHDAIDIAKGVILSSFTIIVTLLMSQGRFHGYSRAVFIIDLFLTMIFVGGTRFMMLVFREFFVSYHMMGKRRILIVGAGDAGATILREIKNNRGLDFHVIGFIDDDNKKIGTEINGVPVLGNTHNIGVVASDNGVGEVIIAMPSAGRDTILRIADICKKHNIKYGKFPLIKKLLDRLYSNN